VRAPKKGQKSKDDSPVCVQNDSSVCGCAKSKGKTAEKKAKFVPHSKLGESIGIPSEKHPTEAAKRPLGLHVQEEE